VAEVAKHRSLTCAAQWIQCVAEPRPSGSDFCHRLLATVLTETKSRMISIRISDPDYREIKSRCGDSGIANVSAFVRAATMYALSSPDALSSPVFSSLQFVALQHRVNRLDEQVAALAEHMDSLFEQSE
jgi:hypothetical protein